jgi:hypothetical protein
MPSGPNAYGYPAYGNSAHYRSFDASMPPYLVCSRCGALVPDSQTQDEEARPTTAQDIHDRWHNKIDMDKNAFEARVRDMLALSTPVLRPIPPQEDPKFMAYVQEVVEKLLAVPPPSGPMKMQRIQPTTTGEPT